MMPELQILLDKGKVTFDNNNNKRKRFQLLNFPHAAILDVTVLSYCFKQKNLSFQTIETTQWRHKIQDGGAGEI